jgi:hypothetical protein
VRLALYRTLSVALPALIPFDTEKTLPECFLSGTTKYLKAFVSVEQKSQRIERPLDLAAPLPTPLTIPVSRYAIEDVLAARQRGEEPPSEVIDFEKGLPGWIGHMGQTARQAAIDDALKLGKWQCPTLCGTRAVRIPPRAAPPTDAAVVRVRLLEQAPGTILRVTVPLEGVAPIDVWLTQPENGRTRRGEKEKALQDEWRWVTTYRVHIPGGVHIDRAAPIEVRFGAIILDDKVALRGDPGEWGSFGMAMEVTDGMKYSCVLLDVDWDPATP